MSNSPGRAEVKASRMSDISQAYSKGEMLSHIGYPSVSILLCGLALLTAAPLSTIGSYAVELDEWARMAMFVTLAAFLVISMAILQLAESRQSFLSILRQAQLSESLALCVLTAAIQVIVSAMMIGMLYAAANLEHPARTLQYLALSQTIAGLASMQLHRKDVAMIGMLVSIVPGLLMVRTEPQLALLCFTSFIPHLTGRYSTSIWSSVSSYRQCLGVTCRQICFMSCASVLIVTTIAIIID